MWKIFALVLALVLLAGCASVAEPAVADVTPTEAEETTTEVTTTTAIAIEPREWYGVPQAFWPVLDAFYLAHDPRPYVRYRAGFAVVDINNDGVLELVLLRHTEVPPEIGQSDYMLSAIYTVHHHEAIRLNSWPLSNGVVLTADGIIYSYATGSRGEMFRSSYNLAPNATLLTHLSLVRQNEYDGLAFWSYIDPPNPMQFNFIPIEQ
ncbi:MAG: hypothetical protein FWB76_05790 [Oscillospiraceae bacterium]|nr:hypothetical protein [Oscillospiraceae bacterium]